jgi:PAS domain S-box-containing protein
MTWIDYAWVAAISACFTLALIHTQIALRMVGRLRWAHAFFTLAALAVGITGIIELRVMNAETVEAYRASMFLAQFSISLMFVSIAGFTWFFFEQGRRAWPIMVIVLALLTLTANIMLPPEMQVRYAVSIRRMETFGGAVFTLGQLRNGPVTVIELMTALTLVLFVIDAAARGWRRGQRRQAIMVGGGIVFFLAVTRIYAALIEQGLIETPYFFIFPFLALLVAMGIELGFGLFEGARLAGVLKESERQVALAAEAATLGFWRWDMKRNALWATPGARAMFGFTPDEPLPFPKFEAQVHPDDVGAVRDRIAAAVSGGGDYEAEYRIRSEGGGERWIAARGRIERNERGEPLIMRGVVIDITDKKHAQHQADEMRRELAHVSRASILGELAGSLAHEINQPLTAILSNAQAARRMLAGGASDPVEIRDIIEDIINDDKRAGEVIRRLRAMVEKKEANATERIDLDEVVRDVARLLNSEILERQVKLVIEPSAQPAVVIAGRVEVQQVLINLMVNAMDAMRDLPREDRRLTLRTGQMPGHAFVTVSDTGPGVPEPILRDIFRPFFTTKSNGLGMGLAVSRYLVEAHRGTLTVDNAAEGGALFRLVLPLAGGEGT